MRLALSLILITSLAGCVPVRARKERKFFVPAQPKIVAVFIDRLAMDDFAAAGISAADILAGANQNFRYQLINIQYSSNTVIMSEWKNNFAEFSEEFRSTVYCRVAMVEAAEKEKKNSKVRADIYLFLTGNKDIGEGVAPTGYKKGKGLILLGTKNDPKLTGIDSLDEWFDRLVKVMMHEQAHLYGLPHVMDRDSIMHPFSDVCGDKFDAESRKLLQNVIKKYDILKRLK